jgi:hypothetical protein
MKEFFALILFCMLFLNINSIFAERFDRAYLRGARHIHHHDEHKHSHGDRLMDERYGMSNYYWRADWPTNSLGFGYETTHTPTYEFNPYYYYNGVQVSPERYYQELYNYYYGNEEENNNTPEYYPEYYFVPTNR